MATTVLGVLVSGRGSNLQAMIDAIAAGTLDARIGVVISDVPAVAALERANLHAIPTQVVARADYHSKADFEHALADTLMEYHVDLVILAGFMRILSPLFIQRFTGRIMNIHPSLLPAFKGLHPHEQALDYGVKVSGCTVHFVDEGMDSGPIILQQVVAVLDDDTPDSLAERVLQAEHQTYAKAIQLFCSRRLKIAGRRVSILPGVEETR